MLVRLYMAHVSLLPVLLTFLLVTVVDRAGPLHPGARWRVLGVGIFIVLFAVASGIWAWRSTPIAHVGMQ